MDHVKQRGIDLFRVARQRDLEGIVAKWRGGTYHSGPRTSWLKIRNPEYSQWDGRRELFESRRDNAARRGHWVRPELTPCSLRFIQTQILHAPAQIFASKRMAP